MQSSLNSNKAIDYDTIPIFFLKVSSNILAYYLHGLIEFVFNNGTFPNNCKISKVVPIYKSEDKNNPTNFRRISILTCFSKIFEKLLYKRLFKFFENKVLNPNQHGFQKKLSTTPAVLDIVITTYGNINYYTGLRVPD